MNVNNIKDMIDSGDSDYNNVNRIKHVLKFITDKSEDVT